MPVELPGIRLGLIRLRRSFLRAVLPLTAALVVLGGGGLAALESGTVHSFGDGVWWALSLMTTVGFTAGVPTTAAGKVLSAVLMVGGFVVLATTTAAIASLFVRADEFPDSLREREFDRETLAALGEQSARLERIERQLAENLRASTPPRPMECGSE